MHRILGSQTVKIGPHGVVLEQVRVRRIQFCQGDVIDIAVGVNGKSSAHFRVRYGHVAIAHALDDG